MANLFKVKGVKQTIQGLQKAAFVYEKGVERGLKKAGLLLQRNSQKIVPVRFGILRNSAFTRAFGSGSRTKVLVGYTANYAIYVHENLDAAHKEGKQAKYLEDPLKQMIEEDTIRKMIVEEARP